MAQQCQHVVRGSVYEPQTKPPAALAVLMECEKCGEDLPVYKYTPAQCERRKAHVVHPAEWPLVPRRGSKEEVPSAALPCDHCGATVIIYNGLEPEGVRIIDPKGKKELVKA